MKTIKLVTESIYLMGYNEKNEACCYYPLTKEAKELDLLLLPNPFEEVDIEKLSKDYAMENTDSIGRNYSDLRESFIEGYKAAQTKGKYSLEDMKKAIEMAREADSTDGTVDLDVVLCFPGVDNSDLRIKWTREEIIQSLSTQQLPKEFIMKKEPIYEERYVSEMSAYMPYCIGEKPWIITNSEGREELVGTYEY